MNSLKEVEVYQYNFVVHLMTLIIYIKRTVYIVILHLFAINSKI